MIVEKNKFVEKNCSKKLLKKIIEKNLKYKIGIRNRKNVNQFTPLYTMRSGAGGVAAIHYSIHVV